MPSELEELVSFIANPNPQVRQLAVQNLVPFSLEQPQIFKTEELKPIKHLKLLVRDHPKIAEHVLAILVNLSGDPEILENLATDEKFLDVILLHITSPKEPNANLLAMLLANLAKSDSIKSIMEKKQPPPETLGSDDLILNQLMDLFVKGADGSFNKDADYDYLAYVFADLAKHPEIRQHFIRRQEYDSAVPLTKIRVFTEHKSDVRRKGVASTIKNAAFDVPSHPSFLAEDEINILPYILLPIMGPEDYDDNDTMGMLPDLQLLPPDKQRDSDPNIIQTHVETLLLLSSSRKGRDLMREIKVYPIIRETHLRVNDEGVQEACERLVNLLMGDEEEEPAETRGEDEDDDMKIVEV
ncbi:hypothetical protein GE09DRAFT_1170402 [Coniochaeta sp. 2T2.1]|nr:hypothetical protein GE09DRAFT_1170402 [Coniochaeta sp. 2T2.1]